MTHWSAHDNEETYGAPASRRRLCWRGPRPLASPPTPRAPQPTQDRPRPCLWHIDTALTSKNGETATPAEADATVNDQDPGASSVSSSRPRRS